MDDIKRYDIESELPQFLVEPRNLIVLERAFLGEVGQTDMGKVVLLVRNAQSQEQFVAQGDHFHLYIEVVDLAARHEELNGGGAQVSEIKAQSWGREFVVTDPEGHRIYYAEKASG